MNISIVFSCEGEALCITLCSIHATHVLHSYTRFISYCIDVKSLLIMPSAGISYAITRFPQLHIPLEIVTFEGGCLAQQSRGSASKFDHVYIIQVP